MNINEKILLFKSGQLNVDSENQEEHTTIIKTGIEIKTSISTMLKEY